MLSWFNKNKQRDKETVAEVVEGAQIAIIKSIPDTTDAEEMLNKAKAVQSLGEVSKGEKKQKLDPNVIVPVAVSSGVTVGLFIASVFIQRDMVLDLKPLDKARAFGDAVLRFIRVKK